MWEGKVIYNHKYSKTPWCIRIGGETYHNEIIRLHIKIIDGSDEECGKILLNTPTAKELQISI